MTIWECEIGFVGYLPANANKALALRGLQRIINKKFKEMIGGPDFVFCTVDGQLTSPTPGGLKANIHRQATEAGLPMTVFHYKAGVRRDVDLPQCHDSPIRQLANMMFEALFRKEAEFSFSGWGSSLTEDERKTIGG